MNSSQLLHKKLESLSIELIFGFSNFSRENLSDSGREGVPMHRKDQDNLYDLHGSGGSQGEG